MFERREDSSGLHQIDRRLQNLGRSVSSLLNYVLLSALPIELLTTPTVYVAEASLLFSFLVRHIICWDMQHLGLGWH